MAKKTPPKPKRKPTAPKPKAAPPKPKKKPEQKPKNGDTIRSKGRRFTSTSGRPRKA